jgi:hypothetical protein
MLLLMLQGAAQIGDIVMAGPSYSYNPGALDLPLNQIRFLIQDTGYGIWRFSDQEIEAVAPGGAMGQTTVRLAAISLCERLAAKYAGLVDISEGAASASLGQLAQNYRTLAIQLRNEGASSAPAWAKPQILSGEWPSAFGNPLHTTWGGA